MPLLGGNIFCEAINAKKHEWKTDQREDNESPKLFIQQIIKRWIMRKLNKKS